MYQTIPMNQNIKHWICFIFCAHTLLLLNEGKKSFHSLIELDEDDSMGLSIGR